MSAFLTQLTSFFTSYASKVPQTSTVGKGAVTVFVGYLLLVRLLRYKRYNALHKKYQKKYEERTLTPEEAQEIMLVSSGYDMPSLLNYSLAFALFKTYAIPTISKLLAATKELKANETISKRYADTEILIATWVGCPISGHSKTGELDPRAMIALARVNYLHSKYNISNGDYLYTLILFAVEPATWAARHGWRSLSPLEEYAYCIFWVEIGKRMGIHDIPATPEAMRLWARAYEKDHMVPDKSNKEVAHYTTAELLYAVPERFGIRRWVEGLTVCMLDEPVRIAMMQPEQPWYKHFIVSSVLKSSAFIQYWLLLPRLDSNYRLPIKLELGRNKDGSVNPLMHPNKFAVRPWYKPESKGTFGRLVDKMLVWANWHSEVPGSSLRSGGYRLEELGPLKFEKTANEEVIKVAERLQGCPITGPFARQR